MNEMMSTDLAAEAFQGLGRLCANDSGDRIVQAPGSNGLERIEAWFHGPVFDPHRHDTYAIGVTLSGVQSFRYRGAIRHSLPGQLIVLHPDEVHDGGAGTENGLRYRMLYLEPSLLADAMGGVPLPFVPEGIVNDDGFRAALAGALGELDQELDELFVDDFIAELASFMQRHASRQAKPLGKTAWRAANLARDYLKDNASDLVRSEDLEAVTGLDRYALSRHFRAAFSSSPHRFLVMRRLEQAKSMMAVGTPLAEIAAAAGFCDQSHFNRQFKKAFGVTPGRWSALIRGEKPVEVRIAA